MPRLELLEDEIGRKLREAELSGELRAAKGYGERLSADEGWEQTPEALRMPFKVLKDAGVIPPEVEMLSQRAQLRVQLSTATDNDDLAALRQKLSALELQISLRLESMRSTK
jgi:hypothetical protein